MTQHSSFTLPLLEWRDIPAGEVTLQRADGVFAVHPFKIARYPVTNAQFDAFIADGGYADLRWWQGPEDVEDTPENEDIGASSWRHARTQFASPQPATWPDADSPRTDVSWYEAVAFTRWLADKTGLPVRLPTEWEWQWAASGATGWDYPYGADFDAEKCNTYESGIGRTTPVTRFAAVETVFGTVDMTGNVLEWCTNAFETPTDILISGTGRPAMRGGSWGHDRFNGRSIHRFGFNALNASYAVGFRVAY